MKTCTYSFVAAAILAVFTNVATAAVNWDFNLSGASGGTVANIENVNEVQFLASSILGFRDGGVGGAGTISVGDTFQDYTVIRLTVMTDQGGNEVDPSTYGSGGTHEITVKMAFSGVQVGANEYLVTSIDLFEVYFDYGDTFTGSNFNNLTTFVDSPLSGPVETAVLGGLSGGNTSGPTAPDGTIDLVLTLFDQLNAINGQYFELDSTTGAPLTTALETVLLGFVDANNDATPPAQTLGGLNGGTSVGGNNIVIGGGFADLFTSFGLTGTQANTGIITSLSDGEGAFDFAFQTRSDGSFAKAVEIVPEPASMLVWSGLSIVGFGLAAARKRRLAAKTA
jgi:hypothetical protein